MRAGLVLLGLWLGGWTVSAFGWQAAAENQGAELQLSGGIEPGQRGEYLRVPFVVPPGIERLTVHFAYERRPHTTLDLGLEDPQRLRGWSGGNKLQFTLSASDATPSYLPGPLVPGVWHLIVGVADLPPGKGTSYRATVHLTRAGQGGVEGFAEAPLSREARWYRGDLHSHTAHSDGSCPDQGGAGVPCPVFVTLQQAVAKHLDFLAITDHNTTSQYDDERETQPYFSKLLLIPGREMTTYAGHANVFGTTAPIDFLLRPADRGRMFAEAHALGALISINHPVAPPGVECIGCGWVTKGFDMRQADALEVINGDDAAMHELDLAFWQRQLNAGLRLPAIGGSDTHRPLTPPGGIGVPTTVVYAAELSPAGILDGVRAGHVFVDVQGTPDRVLALSAKTARAMAAMGDVLAVGAGEEVTLQAHLEHCAGLQLEWIVDGTVLRKQAVPAQARADLAWTYVPEAGRHEAHAVVRDAAGGLAMVANPIYLNWPEQAVGAAR